MLRVGSKRSASAQSRFSPSTAKQRAITRFTLPSRIAARLPNAKAAIAPAVERPMPGSSAIACAARGNPRAEISIAALRKLRPRA